MLQQIRIEKAREDGAKLEIRVSLIDGKFSIKDVGVKTGRQRNFRYVEDKARDDYSYRMLDMEERRKYMMNKILNECPVKLLNEALEEAWHSIKPDPIVIDQ